MAERLESILSILHSKKSIQTFLEKAYHPGKSEIADTLLSFTDDIGVIKSEMEHAQETGNHDRYVEMGKKAIDYYFSNDSDFSVRELVIKSKDETLAVYAVEGMISESRECSSDGRYISRLKSAVEITESFNMDDLGKKVLEKLLVIQQKDPLFYEDSSETLKKLGRFDEAIDVYLKNGSLRNAYNLAKEHSQKRLDEIADFVLRKSSLLEAKLYLECGRQLGQKETIKRILVDHAGYYKGNDSPADYKELVEVLVDLGYKEEATELVVKIAKNSRDEARKKDFEIKIGLEEDLAYLYHKIGFVGKVTEIYEGIIDYQLRETNPNDHTIKANIDTAFELTRNPMFLEKKMRLYELQGNYSEAQKLAAELNKPNLAEVYGVMQQMVSEAKSA